jgi:hypothetical protein
MVLASSKGDQDKLITLYDQYTADAAANEVAGLAKSTTARTTHA